MKESWKKGDMAYPTKAVIAKFGKEARKGKVEDLFILDGSVYVGLIIRGTLWDSVWFTKKKDRK